LGPLLTSAFGPLFGLFSANCSIDFPPYCENCPLLLLVDNLLPGFPSLFSSSDNRRADVSFPCDACPILVNYLFQCPLSFHSGAVRSSPPETRFSLARSPCFLDLSLAHSGFPFLNDNSPTEMDLRRLSLTHASLKNALASGDRMVSQSATSLPDLQVPSHSFGAMPRQFLGTFFLRPPRRHSEEPPLPHPPFICSRPDLASFPYAALLSATSPVSKNPFLTLIELLHPFQLCLVCTVHSPMTALGGFFAGVLSRLLPSIRPII